jgi:hypothetical protein
MKNPRQSGKAILVDPDLLPDRRNRGLCGRIGDSINLTRMTQTGHLATRAQASVCAPFSELAPKRTANRLLD